MDVDLNNHDVTLEFDRERALIPDAGICRNLYGAIQQLIVARLYQSQGLKSHSLISFHRGSTLDLKPSDLHLMV